MKTKSIVAGLGEIGLPILKLISKTSLAVGYDINDKLMNKKHFDKVSALDTEFLHICIPFTDKFTDNVLSLSNKFNPKIIVIHSTIKPNTTKEIQNALSVPVIYSATRGVHKRMLRDLRRYTKFYSVYDWAPNANHAAKQYEKQMKNSKVKTKRMSSPLTLKKKKIIVRRIGN